jgi:Raf kinase inhibitor-like YbhB/YbcL family protein
MAIARSLQACLPFLVLLLLAACGGREGKQAGGTDAADDPTAFRITSPAFAQNDPIPAKHTAAGEGISPPLAWENVPEGTVCFAVICEDANAADGPFAHWGVYNIPKTASGLPEALPAGIQLPGGIRQALNDFGNPAYGGPAPSRGETRTYHFKVYALDSLIELESARASVSALAEALSDHILAEAVLVGSHRG